MARVICDVLTATSPINGIRFEGEPGALVSDEIPDEVAAELATIPGYRLVPPAPETPSPAKRQKPADTDASA